VSVDFNPFDVPPFEAIEYTLSKEVRAERRLLIQELEAQYDQLLATYPESPNLRARDKFGVILQRVVPPILWPYYEVLTRDVTHAQS